MIITETKPYGIIRGMLKKRKKTGIISCNSCARACETGGRAKMEELAERLKKDEFNIIQTELVPMACNVDLIKKPELTADELLLLACDAAVFTVYFSNDLSVQKSYSCPKHNRRRSSRWSRQHFLNEKIL